MKVLCVCEGGNCRSVALAYLLKDRYRQDALACGAISNSPETLAVLYRWADKIVALSGKVRELIPKEYGVKTVLFDVGEDRWFPAPFDHSLLHTLDQKILESFSSGGLGA